MIGKKSYLPKKFRLFTVFQMGRWSTSAIILDELKIVSITDLKRYGYLQPGTRSGTLSWSYYGNPTGSVSISVSMWASYGYLYFSYTYNHEQSIKYDVLITAVPTNLGIGQRWYFTCPRTGKRCTKLFMANGYFQHRDGVPCAMYRSQTRSHYSRSINKVWDAHDRLYRPYMKWHYRGKPTKRYLRAAQANRAAEPVGVRILEKI